jgi:hypothetical protein
MQDRCHSLLACMRVCVGACMRMVPRTCASCLEAVRSAGGMRLMSISLITYCFPSFLLVTRIAEPNEPLPSTFPLMKLSMSWRAALRVYCGGREPGCRGP